MGQAQRAYEQIKRALGLDGLLLVLRDSSDKACCIKLAQLMGITFPGVRMQVLPREELEVAIAEEFAKTPEAAGRLISALIQLNRREIEQVRGCSVAEIRERLNRPGGFEPARLGRILWAMAVDPRATVNREARKLSRDFSTQVDFVAGLGDLALKVPGSGGPLAPVPARKPSRRPGATRAELLAQVEILTHERDRALQENARLKEQMEGWKRDHGKLTAQVGELKQALEAARRATPPSGTPPVTREPAEKALHELRKENRRLAHDLSQARARAAEADRLAELLRQRDRELSRARTGHEETQRQLEGQALALERRVEEAERELARLKAGKVRAEAPAATIKAEGRLAILADVANLSSAARRTYGGRIDYERLMARVVGSRRVTRAIAYLLQWPEVDYSKFIGRLQSLGFQVRTKRVERGTEASGMGIWDADIARDALSLAGKVETIVLLTGAGGFADLAAQLGGSGIRVEVASVPDATAPRLKDAAHAYHAIDRDMMEAATARR